LGIITFFPILSLGTPWIPGFATKYLYHWTPGAVPSYFSVCLSLPSHSCLNVGAMNRARSFSNQFS
jgi:hypothetical protein